MSYSPNSSKVRFTIDENYANKKRASSMKWILVNGLLFFIFTYDLSCKCEGYTTFLHYVEMCAAGVLAANMLQHARCLLSLSLTRTKHSPNLNTSNTQFDQSVLSRSASSSDSVVFNSSLELSDADLSICSTRAWRRGGAGEGGSPSRASLSPRAGGAGGAGAGVRDEFIADHHSLAQYLKEYEESDVAAETSAGRWGAGGWEGACAGPGVGAGGSSPRPYHVASLPAAEGGSGAGAGMGSDGEAAAAGSLWRRVNLDPAHLTQFNLNLRTWLHVTILERLVREMAAMDEALAKCGLPDVKLGQVSVERVRQASCHLAAGGGGGGGCGGAGAALLPFLEVCADQAYLVQRIRELAVGGCLSNYRWCGGGAAWSRSKPCDAELLLRLLAVYLWSQRAPPRAPPPAPRAPPPASPLLCQGAPPPPPRPDISLHAVRDYPPHYVLALEDDTIEVGSGHNNLLHTLVVALAWGARRDPPALWRLHLGAHALNMLWIIRR